MSNQNQIPLPSSRADMERRRPRGKQVVEVDASLDKHKVTEGEVASTFSMAKLPIHTVSAIHRNLLLGKAMLSRAKSHALLARARARDEAMIAALEECVKRIEKVEEEWPVKIV
jgi:hypothetical protein